MLNTNELSKHNLTMLTDFYEITMANGFFTTGNGERITYFDMFFRTIPDDGGLAIMAGVEQVIGYIKNLSSPICAISGSPAMCGRCRRARPYSRRSRS